MEEIKVEEYIYNRYNGEISKYKKIDDKRYIDTKTGFVFDVERHLILGKTSRNIIDLIEVGDYVNGKFVSEIKQYESGKSIIALIGIIEENDIKTIVTKEQFKSMEYRLEE